MLKNKKLIYGVGYNNVEYFTHHKEKINGRWKQVIVCDFYKIWYNMLRRCYSSFEHKRKPTYIGCSIDSDWLHLSHFKSWMEQQDYKGKCLDKDLLIPGNKIYSDNTCVFIGQSLNKFLTDSGASRGKWPIGVSLCKGRFISHCRNPFTGHEYLGSFDTPEEAHLKWKVKKHEHACKLADLETDPRIQQALRTRFA